MLHLIAQYLVDAKNSFVLIQFFQLEVDFGLGGGICFGLVCFYSFLSFFNRSEDRFNLCGLELITCPLYLQNIHANYCVQGQNMSKGSHCSISTQVYDHELHIPFSNLKA